MHFFTSFLHKEKQHFFRLNDQGQRLLISIFLYSLISPIFSLFLNAFLWRQTQSFLQVATYNLIFYLTIPFGFYLNGVLMKYYSAQKLYLLGLLLGTISVSILMFIPTVNLLTISIFGCLLGLTGGVYWANRNLLTLRTTESDNRIYFSGLETTSGTITNIAIPFLIGLFITVGASISLYTPVVAYKILAIIMLLMSAIIGTHILGMKPTQETISSLWIRQANVRWKKFRWYEFCIGVLQGTTSFVPVLMVFVFVGKEDALGILQSLSAILSSLVVYHFAKKLTVRHRLPLATYSIIICVLGAVLFSIFFSPWSVYAFFASYAIGWPLLWISLSSLNYDLIDEDRQSALHYAYVCDQEIYLNLGRVLMIGLFILLILVDSKSLALRFAPLVYALFQIILFFVARSLEKK